MEHSSLARTRWKPPGRLSTQSLRGTTRLAPTGVEVGGRKRLTRLSLRTAVGTTPYPRSHPDDVPSWGRVRVRLDRGRARSDAGSPAVGCPRRCSAIGRARTPTVIDTMSIAVGKSRKIPAIANVVDHLGNRSQFKVDGSHGLRRALRPLSVSE